MRYLVDTYLAITIAGTWKQSRCPSADEWIKKCVWCEISPHTSQNGHHQKVYKQEMLERVWRKGNTLALLVGM